MHKHELRAADEPARPGGASRRALVLLRTGIDRVRAAWLMFGITLLLIAGVEVSCRLFVLAREQSQTSDGYEAAYADADWVPRYRHEFQDVLQVEWQSWIYWRRRAYSGTWINIDAHGLRRTWQPQSTDDQALRILVFGGSTVWGTGSRDEHTIPSYLAKSLDARGVACQVINCGETGYVSRQELFMLTTMLQQGERPDIAVFYDGVNDVFSAFQNQAAGLPQNEANRRREFGLYRGSRSRFDPHLLANWALPGMQTVSGSIARRIRPAERAESEPEGELAAATCANYVSVVEMTKALESHYGFHAFHFWQPTLFDKSRPTDRELQLAADAPKGLETFSRAVHRLIGNDDSLQSHTRFRDLSATFAEHRDTVFIDDCHITEAGNRIVAEQIAIAIAEHLSHSPKVVRGTPQRPETIRHLVR